MAAKTLGTKATETLGQLVRGPSGRLALRAEQELERRARGGDDAAASALERLAAERMGADEPRGRHERVLEFRRRILASYAGEEQAGREAWWRGTCDSVCFVLEEEGLFAEFAGLGVQGVVWGGFRRPGAEEAGHCFLILADETIVDPTSRQFGLEDCAVVPPDDPRHSWYVYDRASTDATSSHVQPPSPARGALASERAPRVGGRSAGTVPATS